MKYSPVFESMPSCLLRHVVGAINVLGSNATIMGLVQVSSNTALNGGTVHIQQD